MAKASMFRWLTLGLILGLAASRALQGDRAGAAGLRDDVDPRVRGLGSIPARLRLLEAILGE